MADMADPIKVQDNEPEKDQEPPAQFDTDELKEMYKNVRDIKSDQLKVENHVRRLFDEKQFDDEKYQSLKEISILALNDFIQETSNSASYADKRYLYRLKYKILAKGLRAKFNGFFNNNVEKKEFDFFDNENTLIRTLSKLQDVSKEDLENQNKIKQSKKKVKALKQLKKKTQQVQHEFKYSMKMVNELKSKIQELKTKYEGFINNTKLPALDEIKDDENKLKNITENIFQIYSKHGKTNPELNDIEYDAKKHAKLIKEMFIILQHRHGIYTDREISEIKDYTEAYMSANFLLDKIINLNKNIQQGNGADATTNTDGDTSDNASNNNFKHISNDAEIAKQSRTLLSQIDNIIKRSKTFVPQDEKYNKNLNDIYKKAEEYNNTIQKKFIELQEKDHTTPSAPPHVEGSSVGGGGNKEDGTNKKKNITIQDKYDFLDGKQKELDKMQAEAENDLYKLQAEQIDTDIIPDFLHEMFNSIQYKSLLITEYSTSNPKIKALDSNNVKTFIKRFMEQVEKNQEEDFESPDHDKYLQDKTYSFVNFFTNFNKVNGFEYGNIKEYYTLYGTEYRNHIENYKKELNNFLVNFQANIEKIDIRFSSENAWYMFKTYFAFIVILFLMVYLFFTYFDKVLKFFNSVYHKNLSYRPLLVDDSMYYSYSTIFSHNVGGWEYYYEYGTSTRIAIYFALLFLIIIPNLYKFTNLYAGQARVVKTFWFDYEALKRFKIWEIFQTNTHVFDKTAEPLMYYGIILMIIIIIINLLYYGILLTQTDVLKKRYDNHQTINNLYENHFNLDLMNYLLRNDVKDPNGNLITSQRDKLRQWMYIGDMEKNLETGADRKYIYQWLRKNSNADETKTVLDSWRERIGDKNNDDDMITKKYKIFTTYVFVNEYVNQNYKYKRVLLDSTNNDTKPSIFLYQAKSQKNILPINIDSYTKNGNKNYITDIIIAPDNDSITFMENYFNITFNKDYKLTAWIVETTGNPETKNDRKKYKK